MAAKKKASRKKIRTPVKKPVRIKPAPAPEPQVEGEPPLGQSALEKIYFDSIKNAAAQLQAPERLFKAAKKKGCPAFKGSRVYLLPLISWLLSGGGKIDTTDWYSEKAKEQALHERVRRKEAEEKVAPWDEIAFGLNKGTAQLFARLEKLFYQLLPPALKGLPELEIKQRLEAELPNIRKEFEEELKKLGTLNVPTKAKEKKPSE